MNGKVSRRNMLVTAGVATILGRTAFTRVRTPLSGNAPDDLRNVTACVFDTFGTIVDWRSSIVAEAKRWGERYNIHINWSEFTDRWRMGYGPAIEQVRTRERPWTTLDGLNRLILDRLLTEYQIAGINDANRTEWTRVWRRLHPWPDSVPGLRRLRKQFVISPLSNANLALMVHLSKFAQLPWDWIWGSDLVQHYKPDPETYLSVVSLLGVEPNQVLMCAAHVNDLKAARRLGLRTAFIDRPNEFGGGVAGIPDEANQGDFDLVCSNLTDLAERMGV